MFTIIYKENLESIQINLACTRSSLAFSRQLKRICLHKEVQFKMPRAALISASAWAADPAAVPVEIGTEEAQLRATAEICRAETAAAVKVILTANKNCATNTWQKANALSAEVTSILATLAQNTRFPSVLQCCCGTGAQL